MGCESCNSCDNCNISCNVTCNTAQGFCYVGSQLASKHITFPDWGLKTNDHSLDSSLFLKATEWNDFIEFIYDAYCHGEYNAWGRKGNETSFNNFAIYDNIGLESGDPRGKAIGAEDIMYAEMYNGALKKMRYLANQDYNTTGDVSAGDIIYATTFNNLRSKALTEFKLHSSQCDICNNGCQGCNDSECDSPKYCCDDCSQSAG